MHLFLLLFRLSIRIVYKCFGSSFISEIMNDTKWCNFTSSTAKMIRNKLNN